MRWIVLRWLLVVVMMVGLLMAGGDGPLFPWTNLAGLALIGATVAAMRFDPEYRRLAGRG